MRVRAAALIFALAAVAAGPGAFAGGHRGGAASFLPVPAPRATQRFQPIPAPRIIVPAKPITQGADCRPACAVQCQRIGCAGLVGSQCLRVRQSCRMACVTHC
ncbi:MAG TPA: hypothetical protein VJ045_11440 [Hyphomicrobiaceae bacterium]|nr:hypothetical protein [Hyphomicrobiaceae bacterium]